MTRPKLLTALLTLTILLFLPFVVYPPFLVKLYSFMLFAVAFYLLYSTTGLLSFGHAAFFATGSYGAGYLAKNLGWNLETSLLVSTLGGLSLGYIIGSLAAKREGIYFSMITLAFAQLVLFFLLKTEWTGGEDGLQAIPRVPILGFFSTQSDRLFATLSLLILISTYVVLLRALHSPFGLLLRAARSNEARTEGLGYNVYALRVNIFAFSAALAALAGGLKSVGLGIASLSDAHWHMSGEVVLANLLGGLGNPLGPLAGSLVIMVLQEYLAQWGAWISICLGLIYVMVLCFLKDGLTSLNMSRRP